MRIVWSNLAAASLKEIYIYYKERTGIRTATKIKKNIFSETRRLIEHPNCGQIEMNLVDLVQEHRYILSKHHKIVYRIIGDEILITDIFDSRRDPLQINSEDR